MFLQKNSKDGLRKKSTTPRKKTSKISSGRSSGNGLHNKLEGASNKVTFAVDDDNKAMSLECDEDTDGHLPATQPVDDRVLKGFLGFWGFFWGGGALLHVHLHFAYHIQCKIFQ